MQMCYRVLHKMQAGSCFCLAFAFLMLLVKISCSPPHPSQELYEYKRRGCVLPPLLFVFELCATAGCLTMCLLGWIAFTWNRARPVRVALLYSPPPIHAARF